MNSITPIIFIFIIILLSIVLGEILFQYLKRKTMKEKEELKNLKEAVDRNKIKDDDSESIDEIVKIIKRDS